MWCRKLLLAICFEILLCDYTITHWLLTLKTLWPVSTLMMNTCAKFHSDPSTNFGDITSCKIGVNGQQTTDGGTTWMHDALCLLLLAEAWKFGENKNKQACQLNIWCVFCIIVFFCVSSAVFVTINHYSRIICVFEKVSKSVLNNFTPAVWQYRPTVMSVFLYVAMDHCVWDK